MTEPQPEPETHANAMSADRLRAILAAYGAEPRRWPTAERAAASALLAIDPALAAEIEKERRLDAALALHPEPEALVLNPAAIAAAARRGGTAGVGRGLRTWLPQAASLAAAAVLGFAVGVAGFARAPMVADDIDTLTLMISIEEDML